jgi:hypothetical protein
MDRAIRDTPHEASTDIVCRLDYWAEVFNELHTAATGGAPAAEMTHLEQARWSE